MKKSYAHLAVNLVDNVVDELRVVGIRGELILGDHVGEEKLGGQEGKSKGIRS